MKELEALLARREELGREIKDLAQREFEAAAKRLFEAEAELENFAWMQRTREYDDEGLYPWQLVVNLCERGTDEHWSEWFCGEESGPLWKRLSEHRNLFPRWLLLELFGDDKIVIVYPDRVETADYWGC